MAVSWGGICCSKPPCIAISLRKATYTYDNILYNQAFSVNVPSVSHVFEADYAGIYSGREVNKFQELGLTPIKSDLINAPIVQEFPLNVICKLFKTLEIGLHTQFIGEVLDVLADEDKIGDNGYPLIDEVKPFIYDSSSTSYYSIGSKIYDAFKAEKKKI
jgi:flavin reductase (DIM6/NTAB) family NADH-FMN oxidoreductase RutF